MCQHTHHKDTFCTDAQNTHKLPYFEAQTHAHRSHTCDIPIETATHGQTQNTHPNPNQTQMPNKI